VDQKLAWVGSGLYIKVYGVYFKGKICFQTVAKHKKKEGAKNEALEIVENEVKCNFAFHRQSFRKKL